MKRVYLLGYPLGHSVSPAMQNGAFQAKGLSDWRYEMLARPPDRLDEMLEALRALDCAGANVTIPHKQKLLPFLDELSQEARAIGAVNTIVNKGGRLTGYNTDIGGFERTLVENDVQVRRTCALVLGAGGAAAAVSYALARGGLSRLVLLNRTEQRATGLAGRLHEQFPALPIEINSWEASFKAELIVNATSIGMAPEVNASPLPPGQVIPRGAVVFDLIYNPRETKLLREAREAGARCIGGLDMLIYQGARSFELWTGDQAPIEIMRAAAEEALTRAND